MSNHKEQYLREMITQTDVQISTSGFKESVDLSLDLKSIDFKTATEKFLKAWAQYWINNTSSQ